MPIGPDDVLCSNIQQEAGTLIVQFDGSCHADKGVGGAGAALLELQTQGVTLLQWRALALPKCPDNIFAEAMSANLGADLLSEELVRRKFVVQQAVFTRGHPPNHQTPVICRTLSKNRLTTNYTTNKTKTGQFL